MRELLFRGKRTDTGEWIESSGLHSRLGKSYIIGISKTGRSHDLWEVDTNSAGQYTGVDDKNGTNIFEGDILQFDYIGKNLGVKGLGTVIFENGQFGVKWGWHKEFVSLVGFANTTITVIGNIHDNPELLKEGADNDNV